MRGRIDLPWWSIALYGLPPAAWFAHLLVSYVLVPPACETSTWPLHAATLVFGAVAAWTTAAAWRTEGARRATAAALGALFLLAIILQGAANATVAPCA